MSQSTFSGNTPKYPAIIVDLTNCDTPDKVTGAMLAMLSHQGVPANAIGAFSRLTASAGSYEGVLSISREWASVNTVTGQGQPNNT